MKKMKKITEISSLNSITSMLFPWRLVHQRPVLTIGNQTGREVTPVNFFLCLSSVMLLVFEQFFITDIIMLTVLHSVQVWDFRQHRCGVLYTKSRICILRLRKSLYIPTSQVYVVE